MNLRQKAKFYKKKYLQTKSNYYDFSSLTIQPLQTEKIVASKIVCAEQLLGAGEAAYDIITDDLVNSMKESIKPYIKINTCYYPVNHTYQFFASIRLVKGVEHVF